jgi:putative spermidine/putrescine transport system substrate-binding protein
VEGLKNSGELIPLYRNQTGILYNPARVPNPPQAWDQLVEWIKANPKRFGFNDPSKGGSGQSFVQSAIGAITGGLDQYRDDTEPVPAKLETWNAVWDWMNSMEPYWTYTTSNNDSISRLNSGEFWMTIAWDDDTQVNLKSGSCLRKPGSISLNSGWRAAVTVPGFLKTRGIKRRGFCSCNSFPKKQPRYK